MTAAAAKAEIGHNSASVGEMLAENPEVLFREKDMLPALIESIEQEIADQKADVKTEKGRAAMKSLAYSIATRKTKYDEAGKALNEDLRKQINTVDAVRKSMRDQLDALRDKAKAPAVAWDAEQDRIKQRVVAIRQTIYEATQVPAGVTYEWLSAMRSSVVALEIDPGLFGDQTDLVNAERTDALGKLDAARARLDKEEADRAELERLRAEKAEAERKAREAAAAEAARKAEEERIAAAAKAAAEKAAADERRKAEEAAAAVERERKAEQAKRDAEAAAERRKAQEAEAAREAAAAAERKKAQDAIDEANRKAKAAEEALEAERRAEAAKVAAAEKAKAEQARLDAERQRNQEHRSRLMKAAKEAIMEHGAIKEEAAKAIVLAIVGGNVPNVVMEF